MMFRQIENLVLDAENLKSVFKPGPCSLMQVGVFPGESQMPRFDFANQGQRLNIIIMDFRQTLRGKKAIPSLEATISTMKSHWAVSQTILGVKP